MEENKQETIAKLYSLRAGLSLLSGIYDEERRQEGAISQIENEIRKSEERQGNLRREIEQHRSKTVGTTEDEIKRLQLSIPAYDEEVRKKAQEIEKCRTERRTNIIKYSIGILISLIVFIVAVNLYSSFKQSSSDGPESACAILVAIFSFIALVSNIADIKSTPEKYAKDADPKKELGKPEPRDIIKVKQQELEQRTKEHEEYKSAQEKKISQTQSEIEGMRQQIKEEKEKLSHIIKRFQATHTAVQEQFCSFIDERDWGNIDLIIFNYETGRALDLRDALMQVDNERRNERLVDAIQNASTAICYSIKRGFGALQETLTYHMDALEGKISHLSAEMLETSGQMKAIAENGKAQQALLDKMSISSDRLVNDVQYMCQLAETAYSK